MTKTFGIHKAALYFKSHSFGRKFSHFIFRLLQLWAKAVRKKKERLGGIMDSQKKDQKRNKVVFAEAYRFSKTQNGKTLLIWISPTLCIPVNFALCKAIENSKKGAA
jgi:hypothetical protein